MAAAPFDFMGPTTDPRRFPFPPGIPILGWLLGWGLGRIWPIQLAWPAASQGLGWFLLIAPFSIAVWASITFRRHNTPVNPLGKVTTVVTAGPFRYSRNPMYVTLMLVYIGGILAFRLIWSAVFGEQYSDYRRRVRRWL